MKRLIGRELGFESRKSSAISLFKQARYLCLWVMALVLSACFPAVELQFLVLSIITGVKWIVDSRSGKTNIVIVERRW